LVTATHLPSIAAHGVAHAAAAQATELKRRLQAAGYTLTEAEVKTIIHELMQNPGSPQKLKELEEACKALLPTLEVLKKAYLASH
ncbi:MAG TPA: hypothetical protein VFL57_00835, partial [Bryobacteraceae bacterium]|nr:hypothetical protein [Bryobacteraceae bacterium]